MSEAHPEVPQRGDSGDAARQVAADLAALRDATARNVPTVHTVLRAAERRRHEGGIRMAMMGSFRARPWVSAATAGALVVLAMLVVPLSYEKVTGHQVALSVSGANVAPDRLRGIAGEMKKALHADGVQVSGAVTNGAPMFTFATAVPAGTGIDAGAAAQAFAAELNRVGYRASARVTPIRERVTGSVYAFTRDHLIQVNVDGKSSQQIESEIRAGLTAAGITDSKVSVTQEDGGKKLQVKVEARRSSANGQAPEAPQIELTRNGQPLAGASGHGLMIREEKRKGPDGTTLIIDAQDGAKHATINVPHVETMSDAALTQTVQSQLAAAGIDAKVHAVDGRVEVEAGK